MAQNNPAYDLTAAQNRPIHSGWAGILAMALGYTGLVAANFWLAPGNLSLTMRLWNWSEWALTLTALIAIVLLRSSLKVRHAVLGLGLAAINALSYSLNDPSPAWILQEGLAIWACFTAGMILLEQVEARRIPAFQLPVSHILKSLGFGLLVAVPLALVNNLYFYASQGTFALQNLWISAARALRPAVHEEIVFRFFVLALCFYLLRNSHHPRLVTFTALVLAVVPHSLNHLPDLFLQNPVMGLAMLAATSLLFGLPMAVLQVRKNLETAIAFHWLIDFARFLFGF